MISVQPVAIDFGQPMKILIPTLPPLLTIKQAVGMGVCSDRMLRKMCANGDIKATKVGTDWRIARDPFLRQFGLVD